MPIFSAISVASLDGLTKAVKTAAICVATSSVLPLTPVSVAKLAMSSSILTPNVEAVAVTFGRAWANCSNEVTPFLAVSCILSWMLSAAFHSKP
jgi:hypothetical protein